MRVIFEQFDVLYEFRAADLVVQSTDMICEGSDQLLSNSGC